VVRAAGAAASGAGNINSQVELDKAIASLIPLFDAYNRCDLKGSHIHADNVEFYHDRWRDLGKADLTDSVGRISAAR